MDILMLFVLLIIAASFGMRILKLFRFEFEDLLEASAFSLCIGLGLIAYMVFIMGLAGILSGLVIASLLFLLTLLSFKEMAEMLRRIISFLRRPDMSRLHIFFLVFILLACAITLIGALSPPLGNDSLAYRLVHVKAFSQAQRVSYIPYARESLWPYLIEMLFTLGFAIGSDILAKLIAWSFGLLGAFLIYTAAKRYFSRTAGYISSVIFLLTPAIFNQMTHSYVDIAQAVYAFASLLCLLRYFKEREMKWAALAGLFCGFVLSIKFTAIITLLTLLVLFIHGLIRAPGRRASILKGLCVFLLFTGLFSVCWYLRAYIIKQNPLYPYVAGVFGGHGWARGATGVIGAEFTIARFLKLPWTMTMHTGRYGIEHLGVAYLLFLPLVFLIDRKRTFFRAFGLFIVIYAALWFYIDPHVNRFLFPVLLPLSVMLGCGLSIAFQRRGLFYNIIKAVFVGVFVFNIGLLLYQNTGRVKVAFGMESRQQYLLRTERTYLIADYVNKNLPKDATILMIGEIRSYYIDRSCIHLLNLVDEEKVSEETLKSRQFLDELKKKRIGYVLWYEQKTDYAWLQELEEKKAPIYTCDLVGSDGERYSYKLFEINEL